MSDQSVTPYNERTQALTVGSGITGIVPQNLGEAFRLADAVFQSRMAPYGLNSPQAVMLAMLAGMELGMPAIQSIQSVAVINNRPCMWGDALIGVVRSNPLCLFVRERIEGAGDSMVAYCKTQRRGEDEPVERMFSVEDAKRAGLWQTEAIVTKKRKDGGQYQTNNDSPWFKYPQRMLQMRARAWCLRDVYADVLKGMSQREEVEDHTRNQPEEDRPAPRLQSGLQTTFLNGPESATEGSGREEGFGTANDAENDPASAGEPETGEIEDAQIEEGGESEPDESRGADAGEGDDEQSGEAAEPETESAAPKLDVDGITRNKLIECRDKFVRLVTVNPDKLKVGEMAEAIEKYKDLWKEHLPEHHDFVRKCMNWSQQIARGNEVDKHLKMMRELV